MNSVPGPPLSLNVQFVTGVCNEVFLQWSQPISINGKTFISIYNFTVEVFVIFFFRGTENLPRDYNRSI